MGSFGRLWPQISARRAWDQDGRPVWELHFTPRAAPTRTSARAGSGRKPETIAGEVVDRRGVQLGDLAIDEHRYRVELAARDSAAVRAGGGSAGGGGPAAGGFAAGDRPVVGGPVGGGGSVRAGGLAGDGSADGGSAGGGSAGGGPAGGRPDVAAALAELAAQPENEALRHLVVGRLAAGHDGFPGEPGLEISSARITGQGLGELFDGVFVWRAQTRQDTYTFVVAPDLQARALLIEDPELARALIQLACPRPGDRHGSELENRLQEAISRLGVTAAPGRADRFRFEVPDSAAVLRVKDPLATAAQPDQPAAHESAKSESEMALSAELAELARKVGVRAVRRPSTS